MGRKIERVGFDEEERKVILEYRGSHARPEFEEAGCDYAVIAVPSSIVKRWSAASRHARRDIQRHRQRALHVGLQGGAGVLGALLGAPREPDFTAGAPPRATSPGSGPSATPATTSTGRARRRVSEGEHVRYVVDAMAEIHGEWINELYTGNYNRRCWILDEYESASWASPTVGQHALYLPEYFKTYHNMIFIGEHTSYTHAWIASALESGIRGSVQLLLELGLVDEAKDAVNKWMARWIDI
ncbi:L-amino-acid oxidase [Zalerion maritima]|uniref:L-amino-acid oxidase n=1 Tax=Zalerion maritima TaxID=339359 RepID=A0AAD5RGJ6_9PEZI|nr:L-amino-acid oxidase [Zalerion maritima]